MSEDEAQNASAAPRPLWQWILLAVLPGLIADLAAALMVVTTGNDLEGALMVLLLFMPLAMVPYLIVLSKPYTAARGHAGRAGFVIGFLIVNLFLWGGSCVLSMSTMNFH